MFGRARRLREALADEKALAAVLRQQLAEAREECESWRWAAKEAMGSHDDLVVRRTRERDDAMRHLWAAENELAEKRERIAELASALGRTSERADRLRSAWLRSRRRATGQRVELAEQQRVVTHLSGQLLDAMGYEPGQRRALDTPAVTK